MGVVQMGRGSQRLFVRAPLATIARQQSHARPGDGVAWSILGRAIECGGRWHHRTWRGERKVGVRHPPTTLPFHRPCVQYARASMHGCFPQPRLTWQPPIPPPAPHSTHSPPMYHVRACLVLPIGAAFTCLPILAAPVSLTPFAQQQSQATSLTPTTNSPTLPLNLFCVCARV